MYDPRRGYPVVVPCVLYDDPVRAAGWLTTVLDMREVVRATLPDGGAVLDPPQERPWGIRQATVGVRARTRYRAGRLVRQGRRPDAWLNQSAGIRYPLP